MVRAREVRFSKYKSRTCHCNQDHTHDSRREAGYCNQLALLEKAGEILSYDIQVTFRLDVLGEHICNHRVDFLVINNEGNKEVHEYKGFATAVWALKHKLFKACYPDIPYIIIRGAK